ncbi:hypothetical protein NSK_004110 [Nannochloropsis salina CCMP1776]|jgi:choline transporter-like protein 2/4/5|uniref:Choline transporter-like protein n=1 Tax=Nannochloropsis salina CCMP1776 TaxID=1027361 RepID=A0A4D9D5B2_9STRA|nr:hypothetical protein NSK_004110 [Nannochloropsis salina CCMP1776]|eukprot:TFJ84645.1 hypothetical protein NSK_004110 [Nannochloropsis salina CCMP1776]
MPASAAGVTLTSGGNSVVPRRYILSEQDEAHVNNSKFEAAADFQGPVKKRTCTDPCFLVLLLGAWAAMSWIGREAMLNGHVEVLTNGYDWNGTVCQGSTPFFMPLNIKTMGVCLEECPKVYDPAVVFCIGEVAPTEDNIQKGYCIPQYPSKEIMNRCYITNSTALEAFSMAKSYRDDLDVSILTEFYGDVINARTFIFGIGFGAALILGFLWTWLLRTPGLIHVAVWTVNMLVWACLGALGAFMYLWANDWKNDVPRTHSDREVWVAKGLGIFFLVMCALWLCTLVFLRKRINLAVGLVREAARAVIDMPLIVLYPFLQAAGLVLFLVPWSSYSVNIASMGHFEPRLFQGTGVNPFAEAGPEVIVQRFQYGASGSEFAWYMLFVLLWTAQFIIAVGQITLALAVSTWYFTRDKGTIGSGTLCKAVGITGLYHLGTAAFGSLVIAVVEAIRSIIAYVQKILKRSENKVAQYLLCCCQCGFWCLEKILKFVNKNAYIQTAVNGTSFCTSGKMAFFLIARNIMRIGAVSLVSEFVIIIGKVFVSVTAGAISFYTMTFFLEDRIHSPIGPTILVVILAWFTADMFCQIFSMAVSALLQAFIADEEMFGPGERYASTALAVYIDENGGSSDGGNRKQNGNAHRTHYDDDDGTTGKIKSVKDKAEEAEIFAKVAC